MFKRIASIVARKAFYIRPIAKTRISLRAFGSKEKEPEPNPKAVKEIEDFVEKLEKMDLSENPNPEDLFKPSNPEQALSIKLVEAKTPDEILLIYKEEIKRDLTCDENCLLFYFLVKSEAFKKGLQNISTILSSQ